MEVPGDDQTLQAVLDRDLGIENEGLDYELRFQDYVNSNDNLCLPGSSVPAYKSSCSLDTNCDIESVRLNSGRSSEMNTLNHQTLLPNHHHRMMSQALPYVQQQQQHHHTQHSQLQSLPHHHQQQHPQQEQHSSHRVTTSSLFNQNSIIFDAHHHLNQNNMSLPDSPPDSGSEPYSPQDSTPRSLSENHLQPNASGTMPSLSTSLCLGQPHQLLSPRDLSMEPHNLPPAYLVGSELQKLNHLPPFQSGLTHQMSSSLTHSYLPTHFGNVSNIMNQPNKKRKFSDSPNNTVNASMLAMNGILNIKQEQENHPVNQFNGFFGDCGVDDDYSVDLDSNSGFIDGAYQVIKWQPHNATSWNSLTDANFKDLSIPTYRVDADKGFNYSVPDEAFVCQKKNHFQVTVHVGLQGSPKYVRTSEGLKKIEDFYVHFSGIKMESPSQVIKIEQSQSDRSKKPFYPVKVDLVMDQVIKLTVGRLHFSETTSNNMRKKGKPNPDQRYFKLVVALHAHSGNSSFLICASSSERIIVRASNPGQFDSEVDILWQKGHTGESVYHVGRVGINTEHPEEALSVHGNMHLTGHLLQPSDIRAKENLQELDPKNQLENVQKLRIYRYQYDRDFAEHAGIQNEKREDTGVIAQEIIDVLPDAVQSTGNIHLANGQMLENFLVVNKDRIFMENVGAVKELCRLTDNLEVRIDELEKMNKRLSRLRRHDSCKSSISSKSLSSVGTLSSNMSGPPKDILPRSSRSHLFHHHRNNFGKTGNCGDRPTLTAVCGNRFIQITIITLILIMAFCLVAITALYIMERHKEVGATSSAIMATPPSNQSSPLLPTQISRILSSTPHPNVTHHASELVNRSTAYVWSSTLQPNVTHRASELVNRSTAYVSRIELNISTTSATTYSKETENKTSTASSIRPTVVPRPVLPAYPACDKDSCEQMCCPPPPEDGPVVISGGGNVLHALNTDSGQEDLANQSDSMGQENSPLVLTTGTQDNTLKFHPLGHQQHSDDGNFQVVVHGFKGPAYNIIGGHHYRNKRQAARNAEDDVSLMIKELNYTIGTDFCKPMQCQGNNRSYYISMDPLFGYQPVTLQFRMSDSRHVTLCHSQEFASCPQTTDHTIENQSKFGRIVEWILYIGTHFRSIYTFRIVRGQSFPDNNISEICTLRPTSGLTIRDYSLEFERSCPLEDAE